MLIKRKAEDLLKKICSTYPVVTVTGPRQSGKTTMVKMAFPGKKIHKPWKLDYRSYAREDPRDSWEIFPMAPYSMKSNEYRIFYLIFSPLSMKKTGMVSLFSLEAAIRNNEFDLSIVSWQDRFVWTPPIRPGRGLWGKIKILISIRSSTLGFIPYI